MWAWLKRWLGHSETGQPKTSGSSFTHSQTNSPAVQIIDPYLTFKKPLVKLDPAKVKFVVIHHSDNANPAWGVKECHKCHQDEKGWSGIGYHYFVEQSGKAFYGRGENGFDYIGAHVEGFNSRSVGICLDGDYDKQIPTEANLNVVARLAAMLLKRYKLGVDAIRYHIDLNPDKSCPGSKFEPREAFKKRVKALMPA
jgi:N-acetylmuramoyl-L-alanine amidase